MNYESTECPTDLHSEYPLVHEITVSDEVRQYILEKNCDFRVCTSCGGPIILSTLVKPPKASDLEIYIGKHTLYVSIYQAKYIDRIEISMFPKYSNYI